MINVEAQNDFYPGYPILLRGIYSACRMISSQYGRIFKSPHYNALQKVYSTWICTSPPRELENFITQINFEQHNKLGDFSIPKEFYDKISIVLVCLGNSNRTNNDGIVRMLDVLLSAQISKEEKQRILEEEYNLEMSHEFREEFGRMCNLSKGVLEDGIAIGKAEGKAEGIAIGKAEGKVEGIAIGKAEGIAIGVEQTTLAALNSIMKEFGVNAEQAMNTLNVPEEKRQTYAAVLNEKQESKVEEK